MKTISVILTTYNSEKYVEKCLDSIIHQSGINSLFQIELIVIDDCSKDRTCEILRRRGIEFFSTEVNSGGPNKGRNIGLANSSGEYICICDHDDIWRNDRIMSILPFLSKAPILSSGYTLHNLQNGKKEDIIKRSNDGYIYYSVNETFEKKLCKSKAGQDTYLGSLIFRSDLKNITFEENFGVVDYDWVLRLFEGRDSMEITKSLYDRYVDIHNLSRNEEYRKIDYYYSLMILEKYEPRYYALVNLARRRLNGTRARFYYILGDMRKARYFFMRSGWNLKTILYLFSSFIGSKWVRKRFNILR